MFYEGQLWKIQLITYLNLKTYLQKPLRFLFMFMIGFIPFIVVPLFPLLISVHFFHAILSSIDEVHLINLPANVFVFGHFNVLHKDWLTYFGGTNRTRKLCYKPSVSSNLLEMFNYPTVIFDCD